MIRLKLTLFLLVIIKKERPQRSLISYIAAAIAFCLS